MCCIHIKQLCFEKEASKEKQKIRKVEWKKTRVKSYQQYDPEQKNNNEKKLNNKSWKDIYIHGKVYHEHIFKTFCSTIKRYGTSWES